MQNQAPTDPDEDDSVSSSDLIQRYKMRMPSIIAKWDLSQDSIQHNEMPEGVEAEEMVIFDCDMEGFLRGLLFPSDFEPCTLWTSLHWEDNIAKVIHDWERQRKLSPVVIIKTEDNDDRAFVSDGKHRLTVARAIGATTIPFMVGERYTSWAEKTFPSARRVTR